MNELKQICQIQGLNYRRCKRIWVESNEVQRKILMGGFKRIIEQSKINIAA